MFRLWTLSQNSHELLRQCRKIHTTVSRLLQAAIDPDTSSSTSAQKWTADSIPTELIARKREMTSMYVLSGQFRFARRSQGSAALIVKIVKDELIMEEQEQFDNISIEELAEELPENSPRYVVLLSYELKHRDGRTSFPLVVISKVIDVHDGAEGLTKDVIDSKLLSS